LGKGVGWKVGGGFKDIPDLSEGEIGEGRWGHYFVSQIDLLILRGTARIEEQTN